MEQEWTVGIDGSEASRRALAWAAQLAVATDGRVIPVFAWEIPLPIWAAAGRRAFEVDHAGLAAAAAVEAERIRSAVVESAGVDDEAIDSPVVAEGHPSRLLLEWSDAGHPIITGRRGIGALRHRLLGSTSSYLATHASNPVIVVPEAPDGDETAPLAPRRVLVGFDGSEHACTALRWAVSSLPRDAEIVAVTAVDVVPWLDPGMVTTRFVDIVDAERERVGEMLDRADPTGRATHVVELHGPHQSFVERFGEVDLIVVGPRGRGAVARTLLGSITSWLLNESPVPVAVVPSTSDV